MENLVAKARLDKTQLDVVSLDQADDDMEFWASKTPSERLAATEYLRQINYGQDAISGRLQRVLEVVDLK